jgi:hypothetical protein
MKEYIEKAPLTRLHGRSVKRGVLEIVVAVALPGSAATTTR